MHLSTDLGVWIAALLTLGILSFLYKDNPAYKLCEHLFVGVSAGYYVVLNYFSVVKPNLLDPLFHGGPHTDFLLVVPLILGVLLFSGSLYGYALGGPHFLVFVTPFGGITLLVGWTALIWHFRPGSKDPRGKPRGI